MWKSLPIKLGHVLLLYGGWGLLGMSFLDSSVLPFPVVNDLALMVMASHRPAWWPLYGLATTLGSVGGVYLLYGMARGGGELLRRKTTPHSVARAERWIRRHAFFSMLVAALLPPPAPLKLFVLTAGVVRVNPFRFGMAMLVGRGLRFASEAWLGAHYGVQAQAILRHNMGWASLTAVALILAVRLFQRRSTPVPALPPAPAEEESLTP